MTASSRDPVQKIHLFQARFHSKTKRDYTNWVPQDIGERVCDALNWLRLVHVAT
jgi:hypothetical protein